MSHCKWPTSVLMKVGAKQGYLSSPFFYLKRKEITHENEIINKNSEKATNNYLFFTIWVSVYL